MEKSCRKCAPKASPRPLFTFGVKTEKEPAKPYLLKIKNLQIFYETYPDTYVVFCWF